jgi:DivIVA domain-containing protein
VTLLEVVAVALVLFGTVVVATGRGDRLADAPPDGPEPELPAEIAPADVEALRFAIAVRGYRMAQVDSALSRLAAELGRRDDELARLRAVAGDGAPVPMAPPPAPAAADG